MADRISPYEMDAETIRTGLFYNENVTESEKANALVALCQIVDVLFRTVEKFEKRISELSPAPELPDECRNQECTYFRHYLVFYNSEVNGEKLEHAAFHHAEKRCEIAQKAYIDWIENHENADKPIPEHLERQADFWEKKICA